MEVPGLTCSAPPAGDQPTPQPGMPGAPGGQTSPRLALGPVLLPPEQGLAPAIFLKALPVPLYHTVPPGGLQPRAPLVAGGPDGGGLPFILSPLLQPDGLGPTQGGKPPAPTLTVNIVGALPVLSPGLGPPLGSPGKVRKAGKYLCPHCGRDCLKPSVLEKHIRSHTGERPFPCATCGIAFKTQSNLYKHRRTQTHLNNSRLPSEAEAGGGLPEEGDRATTAPRAEGPGQRVGDGPSGRPPSPGVRGAGPCPPSTTHLPLTARKPDVKSDAGPRPGSPLDRETPLDSSHTACPGLPPAGTQPRWKLPEQKSPPASRPCPLQRQQATSWEKPWDAKGSEGRLRKWESTDSGYLSRSDSVEQPPAPASPLHSLSEHSAEAEGTPGPGAVPGPRAAALALEKQQLEERITRLISHNQAVVDDPQLDTVRPRKTVLSQQGSLDLPTPYTYKDSFHFDLRAREPGRHRQAALCTARSACGPGDRARPLFFHSVPTQLSTTVECGPVTRSNSLPLVEGTRTWREQPGPREAWPRKQKPLSPRPGPARLGCSLGLSWAGGPSTHPRALVRQAAVEDLPCAPAGDTLAPAQALDGKGSAAREEAAGKGGGAGKKCGRRKPKMFSQEKWQVYGDETFKRIYQKMKTSHHGGRRGKEERVGEGPGLDPHPWGEATAQPGQLWIPVCGGAPFPPGAASDGAVPGLLGRQAPQDVSLATEPSEQREPEARPGGSGQPGLSRAVSSPLSGRDAPCVGSKSLFLLPAGAPELGGQLARGGQPEAPRPGLPDPKEGGAHGEEGEKEAALCGQSTPRLPSRGSGAPQPVEDKLPSERKKLKVEGLSSLEKSEPLGAGGETGETPDGPARPTSPQEPGGPPQSADGTECGKARPADVPAEPLVLSPAGVPNRSSSQPRPPGFLAQADDAFPPKYLLRLPQRETHSPRPVARESMQEPLCKRAWPQELAPFAGPGKGDPLSPSPASGRTPDAADSVLVDPGCSRLWDGVKGKQSGQDSGTRTDTSTPAPGESPGVAARETASSVATLTCDSVTARGSEGEACTIRHLCMSSPAARAVSSGGLSKPWAPRATEDPPQGPPLWLHAGCCPQAGSFPWAVTLPQGPPPAQAEPASSPHSGTPRSCGAEGPFPSLKAEPQLTWCCLSCSIPLPAEQEGASSVFSHLHPPAGSSLGLDPDPRPLSKAAPEGWISTSLGDRGLLQTWQLSCPRAPGMTSQFRMSEPERKAGLHSRRVRTSRGSGKQKKLRINPKRYRGSFLQRRVQLRASRLHKVALRKGCHPHRLERPDPSRTGPQVSSEVAGLNRQGEPPCTSSESPLCCGNEGKIEKYCRQNSGTFSPSQSSRNVTETDKLTVEDISPSAGEHGGSSPNTAALPGLSPQSDSRLAAAMDNLPPRGKGLDVGLLETQLLLSQEQVSVDAKPCIFSNAQELFSFDSKGISFPDDVATSAAALCTSLGARTGHTTLGIPTAEPQGHSQAATETLAQSPPDRKLTLESTSPSPLPEKPSSGQRLSGSVALGSTGKTHLEIPASGPSSNNSQQEEGRDKTTFLSRDQYRCGGKVIPCPPSGEDNEKCHVPGLFTDCVVPSNPGQPTETPKAPSKTVKRRSLEGMRKQTRVEFSDTSSDDEDRLVIEI